MNIFFNEKSLDSFEDVESMAFFFNELSNELSKVKISTRLDIVGVWAKNWEPYFDEVNYTLRNVIFQLIKELKEASNIDGQFYYHYLTHQNYGLLCINANIIPSSMANAADKILNGEEAVILNIPKSPFSFRPHIPILRSPHNSKIKDELANIPCFDSVQKILQYVFLHENIKPLLKKMREEKDFEQFVEEYFAIFDSFDFHSWKPNTPNTDGDLDPKTAFPACKSDFIKNKLATWSIKKESYNDNKAEYKNLGGIILELHGYKKNNDLSRLYKEYDIYEGGYGNKGLLVSLDTENGGLEVIEKDGTHIGVYGYSGNRIKDYANKQKKIDTHSLKNIPKNKFLF